MWLLLAESERQKQLFANDCEASFEQVIIGIKGRDLGKGKATGIR